MTNRLAITILKKNVSVKNFSNTISIFCAKQYQEPIRSFVTCLQGIFRFTSIDEIYNEKREKI